ncbi:hypothetical protein CspHIS471_0410150 [Cutaneotrichosporon sp. HIS471]|nr:hypothetical protein CspHIS471_0410150 [Cutaneotrichosporon sp. HIS471]
MLAFAFRVVLLATAAAQSSHLDYNYWGRTPHDVQMWAEAVSLVPITDGWEYLYDENRSNGRNTWESQMPPSELSFRNRENRTRLQTTLPGQAMSIFFTGKSCSLGGTFQGGVGFDGTNPAYWSVLIDGMPISQDLYDFLPADDSQTGFISVFGFRRYQFYNVTFVTGPQFNGNVSIEFARWSTWLMRYLDRPLSNAIILQTIGNRISFADGDAVQPLLTPKGDVAVHQYTFQNKEQEAALALKGDASIEVMVPANSSYIECDGYVGPDYGVVNFALDPPPPGNITAASLSRSTNRPWYTVDTMLSLPLNPNLRYKLKVWTEAATAGAGVYLNGSMIYPFSKNEPAPFWIKEDLDAYTKITVPPHIHQVNVGAIAGGTVGGAVFLALLAVLFFLHCRRRSKREIQNIEIE